MKKIEELCTCDDYSCPYNPRNHSQGCNLCIEKNLNCREIPSCFFNMLEDTKDRTSFKWEDFAELVLKNK